MEKNQAKEYIEKVLTSAFDEEQFELFIRNLLNDFEPKDNTYWGNNVAEAFQPHIASYKRIGKYTDPEGEVLDILVVETTSVSKLERTRTALRNFAVRHLKNFEKLYALVAFYSKEDAGCDWRLSLVKIDYDKVRDKKGKIKIKEDLVPAKRFSFLVGSNEYAYTAKKQLLPLLVNDHSKPLIAKEQDGDGSIEGAFGIERVTDEFFEQYKSLFEILVNNDELKESIKKIGLEANRFVKKLLGQIVFIYFLQKKGWLGVSKDAQMGEGSKRFLQDQFLKSSEAGLNYFEHFLKHLFYDALAREHNDEGKKYYFSKLDSKVPFLNGGLFEAEYDWTSSKFHIPNKLFRNDLRDKSGDKGTGILDVFDRYNFTIKEDEPLEKEVAVDPEMLGKVFENMLEITERKGKGAFYTPREIVHYMCQESLIHYLDSEVNDHTSSYQALDTDQTNMFGGTIGKKGSLKLEIEHKGEVRVSKADLGFFIKEGHYSLENDLHISEKGRENSAYQFQIPKAIRTNAESLDIALAEIKICDPAIGSGAFPVGLLHEIVTARRILVPYLNEDYILKLRMNSGITDHDNFPSNYYFKRHAIQESIYGVDIDQSAIDIARLRLWLSLIVEEEDYESIEALPNLDYKIVFGNSLIGLPEGAMRDLKIEADLERLKDDFFSETDKDEKNRLRDEINQKIRILLDSAEQFSGYHIAFDYKLFFSEVWHQKKGFDIVIGNPPYGVSVKGDYRKTVLKQFEKVPDYEIYYFFIELSKKILREKGVNSFIIPNTILFNVYAEKYRKDLKKDWEIHEILDCTNFKLFKNAVVRNIIYLFKKVSSSGWVIFRNSNSANSFSDLIQRKKLQLSSEAIGHFDQNWGLAFKLSPSVIEVVKKIKTGRILLSEINPEISQGLIAYDKYRGQSEEIIKNRAYHHETYRDGLKKWLLGEDITRFKAKWNTKYYIDYCDGIANPRDPKYFNGNRVLIREITNPRIYAAFTSQELYNDPAILIIKASENGLDKYSLTAILNSELATFLHFNNSPKATKGDFPKILISDVKNFPIERPTQNQCRILKNIVEYLVTLANINSKDLKYSFFDQLLSGLIYELYFPHELKNVNKNLFEFLNDVKGISDLNGEDEVHSVISEEFTRLYDPNHPVRNRLETLDSIEEVKIIREGLR